MRTLRRRGTATGLQRHVTRFTRKTLGVLLHALRNSLTFRQGYKWQPLKAQINAHACECELLSLQLTLHATRTLIRLGRGKVDVERFCLDWRSMTLPAKQTKEKLQEPRALLARRAFRDRSACL